MKEFGKNRNSDPGRLEGIFSKKYETLMRKARWENKFLTADYRDSEAAVSDILRTAWLQLACELCFVFLF